MSEAAPQPGITYTTSAEGGPIWNEIAQRLVDEGIAPHKDKIVGILQDGDVAVLCFEVTGQESASFAKSLGWTGKGNEVHRMTQAGAERFADTLDLLDPAGRWLRRRDREGRIFVIAHRGTICLNYSPKDGRAWFEPGTTDGEIASAESDPAIQEAIRAQPPGYVLPTIRNLDQDIPHRWKENGAPPDYGTVAGMRAAADDAWARWQLTSRDKITEDIETTVSMGISEAEWTTKTVGHFILRWRTLGFPTFELTSGLAAALVMTDCAGLTGRDLRLPFGAMAVQMPSPSSVVYPSGDLRCMFFERLVASSAPMLCVEAMTDIVLTRHVRWPHDDERLADWLAEQAKDAKYEQHGAMMRLIVNLCVYINSLHALPPAEGRRKPTGGGKKREKEAQAPQRWVLGREIKLSPGMLQAARTMASGQVTAKQRAAYRMHARWMVRGHWRRQVCGKKRAERRLRWIEPFWKGPEMADGLARLYSVGEQTGEAGVGASG